MDLYICIRANSYGKAGDFFASESEGDDFVRVELHRVGRIRYQAIPGFIKIPYEKLYRFVVPHGFQMKIARATPVVDLETKAHDAIEQFRRDNEEIIEDELQRRGKAANPTYTGRKE